MKWNGNSTRYVRTQSIHANFFAQNFFHVQHLFLCKPHPHTEFNFYCCCCYGNCLTHELLSTFRFVRSLLCSPRTTLDVICCYDESRVAFRKEFTSSNLPRSRSHIYETNAISYIPKRREKKEYQFGAQNLIKTLCC